MADKVVVLLSGGVDSTTLLYHLIREELEVLPIAFDYGQRHAKELEAARQLANGMGLNLPVVALSVSWGLLNHNHFLHSVELGLGALLPGNSQTDPHVAVPEGNYTDASMKQTVVPNRNMIMLSVAAAYGLAHGARYISFAAHAGDHAIYPDCRPSFIFALDRVLRQCHYTQIELIAPLLRLTKAEIVKAGSELGVPFHLCWSCYKGGEKHCGVCGTCVERREAFQLAGVPDPTEYATEVQA